MDPPQTRVVNVKQVGWNIVEVYIGRNRYGNGAFGNPVKIGYPCPVCRHTHHDAGSTLPCYRIHLLHRITEDSTFRRRVQELGGKILGCYCKPGPCHGDVLSEVAEALAEGGLAAAQRILEGQPTPILAELEAYVV